MTNDFRCLYVVPPSERGLKIDGSKSNEVILIVKICCEYNRAEVIRVSQLETSLKNSQSLIDILLQFKNENGISVISQCELARCVEHSQTWVSQAIRRINTEDVCIERIGMSEYIVHYSNLMECGVYSTLFDLFYFTQEQPEIFSIQDAKLVKLIDAPIKTIQMYKAFMRDFIMTAAKTRRSYNH